jgi:hypothetical protein
VRGRQPPLSLRLLPCRFLLHGPLDAAQTKVLNAQCTPNTHATLSPHTIRAHHTPPHTHSSTMQILHNLDRACETFSFGSGGESSEPLSQLLPLYKHPCRPGPLRTSAAPCTRSAARAAPLARSARGSSSLHSCRILAARGLPCQNRPTHFPLPLQWWTVRTCPRCRPSLSPSGARSLC